MGMRGTGEEGFPGSLCQYSAVEGSYAAEFLQYINQALGVFVSLQQLCFYNYQIII